MEKINPIVYRLRLPAELRMHPVINIEHLSRYNRDEVNSQTKLKDLQVMGREIEYKVDRILGHHFNQAWKHMEYLV